MRIQSRWYWKLKEYFSKYPAPKVEFLFSCGHHQTEKYTGPIPKGTMVSYDLLTGPEHLRAFLATATEERLEEARQAAAEYKDVGPKMSEVIASWERQKPVLEAFEKSPIDIFNEFWEGLSDEEFDRMWAEVEKKCTGGPLAEDYINQITRR